MPNAKDLREKLGLTDLTTPTGKASDRKTTTPTGGGALQRDLQQAFEEGRGSNALRGVTSQPTSGGVGQVPSTSPLNEPIPVLAPDVSQVSPTIRQISSMPPVSTAASVGIEPEATTPVSRDSINKAALNPIGIDLDRTSAGLDAWEQEAARRENRPVRTANVFGEEYDMDGSDLGWFDNQLNQVGNTPMNDAYIRYYLENGYMDLNDAKDIMGRGNRSYWDMLVSKWDPTRGQYDYDVNKDSTGNVTAMDDGSSYDYDHVTADKMTGVQYMRYAEMGMGGRPIGEIDPKGVYSKRREANEYGFIPFTPDQTAYANMMTSNVIDLPGRLGSMVGNLRQTLTPDYQISYDDASGRRSISGREFDRLSIPFINQFDYNMRFNPGKYLSMPKDGNATPYVKQYVVPDANGRDTVHYGDLIGGSWNDDGTFRFEFNDGTGVDVSEEYLGSVTDENGDTRLNAERVPVTNMSPETLAALENTDQAIQAASEYGGSPLDYANVVYYPSMRMSDGTNVSYDDVERMYLDKTPGDDADNERDDDISYDFSGNILFDNRPNRLKNQEMFSIGPNGGIEVDTTDLGNNAIDWTLGSLPISVGRLLPWLGSASNGIAALSGADPGTYDPATDSYNLIAGDYDNRGNVGYGIYDENGNRDERLSDETKFWNAVGNAAVPLTENIAGDVGSDPFKALLAKAGVPGAVERSAPTIGQLLGNKLIGAVGEGIEEDIGNLFDELTQYGARGLFANNRVDENGEPVTDMYGHQVRDYDTSLGDRVNNFLNLNENVDDLLNSFSGGVAVDALMQSPFLPFELADAGRRGAARRATGVRQFVDPEVRERRTLSDAYLDTLPDS